MAKDDIRRHFEEIAGDYDAWKEKASYYYALLADIYLRMGNKDSAADELESFLVWHPDSPKREGIRAAIEKLRR